MPDSALLLISSDLSVEAKPITTSIKRRDGFSNQKLNNDAPKGLHGYPAARQVSRQLVTSDGEYPDNDE